MSKWAGINYLDSAPCTGEPPRAATALVLDMPAHQTRALQAGRLAFVVMQLVPIAVVDFYTNPTPPGALGGN
mgnify:CR=1 FL=1